MATVAGSLRNKVLVLDDVTTGDLTVTGNVTIAGTATTINSTNTSINDHLIELNAGLTGTNANDTGLILERGSTGNNVFIGWDESADKVIVATTTSDGTATGNLTLAAANFQAADISMTSGASSGKFAVKSAAVHGSFDFYNNGTSYFNGTTEVNAEFKISSSSSYTTHFNYQDGGNNIISQANGGSTAIRNSNGDLFRVSNTGHVTMLGNATVEGNFYIGAGSNDGYFYSDQNGRTAFANGDFYIQNSVTNYYNYATNQYLGDSSGDNIHVRGNTLDGTGWELTPNRLKILHSGATPATARLLVGATNSSSSSAIAQFGGFIRVSNYVIIHDGAGSNNTVQMRNTGGHVDLTQGEGSHATPATRVNSIASPDGTQLVFPNNNGRVMIGSTATPASKLHVNSGGTNVVATFQSTDGIAGIKLQDSAGNVEISNSGSVFRVQPSGSTPVVEINPADAPGSIFTTKNVGLGDSSSNIKVAYPGPDAQWSASGTSTGQIIIDLPGTLNNYDMMYMEVDIYEYSGDAATKLIIGGHNWNSGGDSNTSTTMWHNVDVRVLGEFQKSIYFGWRNNGSVNKRVIVLGEPSSTWSYGTVHVSKVSGAQSFYSGGTDWASGWNVSQTTGSSDYTKSPSTNFNGADRRVFRVIRAIQGNRIYGDADMRAPIFYDLNDTTYRIDAASTSKLKNLTIGNTDSTIGVLTVHDSGNNGLELKSTGSNAFRFDMVGTGSVGQLTFQDLNIDISGGHFQHFGTMYSRANLNVLNAAGNGWHTWATRSNGKFSLDVEDVSTTSDGTSANWKQAYDNYITGIGVSGTTTKTITLTQRDGGTISTTFTDLQGSTADGVVDSLSFSAGTVRGGTSGTGVLTVGRSGSLSNLTVDLDGRYLQRQYMNNWTRVGYGDGGTTKWHKLCTITITGSYQDYNVGFFWTDRYDRGEASIHVHSDNDTTADVWAARFVSTADSNRKASSDVMYTKSGSTVEVFVKTPSWREFDYIRNDAVTEGTPSITWYDESTTTEYTSQPSNVTAFSDMTPISQSGYNKSFSGDLQDKDNTQYYLDPNDTSVINQLDVATNIRHNGDTDTKIAFTTNEQDFVVGGVTGLHMDSSRLNINPNAGNYDFRVSGDNETNLIYADASTDRIGIGTATPSYDLDIQGASAGLRVLKSANDARVISASSTAGGWFEAISPNYYSGMLHVIGGTEQWALGTLQGQSNYTLRRGRSGAIVLTALTDGKVGINNNTPQRRFVVTDSAGNASDNSGILSLTVGSGANTDAKLAFGIDSGHRGWIHVVKPGSNVYPLLLNPTGSSNGMVGIGFSGQNPSAMLDVEGGALGSTSGDSKTVAIFRAGRQNLVFKDTRTANATDWNSATFKMIAQIDSTNHQSIDFVNDSGFNEHIDILTGNQVFNTRFTANGRVGIGTNNPTEKLDVVGIVNVQRGQVWDATTQGTTRGSIHIDPATGTDHAGGALTFGASDHSNGTAADAGIYIRSDGSYGTRMYLSTTDSYASGSKSALSIDSNGVVRSTRTRIESASDMRASIFYDSNDTARFVDMNGTNTSELGRIRTNASASLTAPRWDTSFYVAQSQHYYGHSASQTMYLGEANHIHIRNIADIAGSARAPVYYDKDNTAYYLDAANSTTAAFVNGTIKINSSHNHGNFVMHYNHGDDTNSGQLCSWISEPGLSYNNGGIGANIHEQGPYYGRFINSGYGVYARFKKSDGLFEIYTTTATRGNTGGQGTRRFYVDASGNSHSIVSSRAPIFYDSDSTSYYTDPASTSLINGLQMAGSLLLTAEGATNIKTRFIMGKASGNTNSGELYLNYGTNHAVYVGSGGTANLHVTGNVYSTNMYVSDVIYHTSDTDTYQYFETDQWKLFCGGQKMIQATEASSGYDYVSFGGTDNSGEIMFNISSGEGHFDGDVIAFSTTTSSDLKLKENIRDLEGALDKTLQLRGVKFDWKDDDRQNDQLGFIAQEIEEVLPEVVSEVESIGDKHGDTHKVVNYQAVVPVLVEAIKELKAEIDELKEQLKKK